MNGLKGREPADLVRQFFGELNRWPVEPDGLNFTQAQIQAIAEHMSKTGDCLWHAEAVVLGWPVCHCADCDRVPRSVKLNRGVQ